MQSELQRLRFRVRQLERELRALRTAHRDAGSDDGADVERDGVRIPEPRMTRRRVLNAPARETATT